LGTHVQQTVNEWIDWSNDRVPKDAHKKGWTREEIEENVYQILRLALVLGVSWDQSLDAFVQSLQIALCPPPSPKRTVAATGGGATTTTATATLGHVLTWEDSQKRKISDRIRFTYTRLVTNLAKDWKRYGDFVFSQHEQSLRHNMVHAADFHLAKSVAEKFDGVLATLRWHELVSHPYWSRHVHDKFFERVGVAFPYLGLSSAWETQGWFRHGFPLLCARARRDQNDMAQIQNKVLDHFLGWISGSLRTRVTNLITIQNWFFLSGLVQHMTKETLPQILLEKPQKTLVYSMLDPLDLDSLVDFFLEVCRRLERNPRKLLREHINEYLAEDEHGEVVQGVAQEWRSFLENNWLALADRCPGLAAPSTSTTTTPTTTRSRQERMRRRAAEDAEAMVDATTESDHWTLDDFWSAAPTAAAATSSPQRRRASDRSENDDDKDPERRPRPVAAVPTTTTTATRAATGTTMPDAAWHRVLAEQVTTTLSAQQMKKEHRELVSKLVAGLEAAQEATQLEVLIEDQNKLLENVVMLLNMAHDDHQVECLSRCKTFLTRTCELLLKRKREQNHSDVRFRDLRTRYYDKGLYRFWAHHFSAALCDMRHLLDIRTLDDLTRDKVRRRLSESWQEFLETEKRHVDEAWKYDDADDHSSLFVLLERLQVDFEQCQSTIADTIRDTVRTTPHAEFHALAQATTRSAILNQLQKCLPMLSLEQLLACRETGSTFDSVHSFLREFQAVHAQVCRSLTDKGWDQFLLDLPVALSGPQSLCDLVVYLAKCSVTVLWCTHLSEHLPLL
jgi:hypothetical protein